MLNKKTFVISILIVFITIISVSYAFFSSNITGTGKDNIVSAGTLSLHFEDGDEMAINDAYPGDKIEKIFTITNTGTLTTSYTMWWKDLTNTYINDELVMSLECNSYKILDGEKTKFGSCENLEETVIGTESKVPIKSNIQIEDGIIHEYKLTILFKEMNKLQNYNMNKTFTGTINIKEYFENETDTPVIEYYSFTNKTLTLKANDSTAITHYALSYGEEDVAALFNTKSKLIMKMNTNDLQWTKVEETNVLQIETPIEDYNVTVHIKNKIGNILSQDLTPKPVVIVNPNGGTWNDSTGEQTYNMTYNETMNILNPTREGYTFDGWDVVGEESKLNEATFTAGIEDTTLTANWTINKYTLTINPNGGEYNDSPSNTTYTLDYKANQTITTPEREGYTFTGWNISSNKAQLSTNELTIGSENCTLTANWQANNYPWIAYHNKMNVSGSGYTLVDADTENGEAAFGSKVTPNVNTYTGFTSPSEKEITIVVDSTPPTKNVVDYNYERNKYALTIDANGGTYDGNNPGEVYYEAEITISNPSKEGYNFGGWTKTGGGTLTDTTFKGGLSASTLTASWDIIDYTITYNLNSGTQGSGAKTSYNIETATFNLPTPTRTGYTFAGWYTTSGLTGTAVTQIAKGSTGNKTYYAKWTQNRVLISFNVNGGTITPTTTADDGTVYNWTTSSSLVYLNGSVLKQRFYYGASGDVANYNNAKYMKITRTGYSAPDGAEWICSSGCTTANKTFDHDATYNASDFCDASNGDCNVVLKVNWQINKVNINFHVNGGTVTASTTADNGTVYNWTTSNSLVYRNGTLLTQSVNHGSTVDIINNNNSKYLKVTRTGYTVPDGSEWICSSGCTTANKTFDHNSTYNASDLCDTSSKSCTVVLKVNWQAQTLYSKILADNPNVSTRTDFSTAFTTSNNGNTIYSASGQDGKTTYYFAGAVTNNYVYFADKYWRIIRINEDNSVRLIYAGTSASDTAGYSSTSQTFHSSNDNAVYVGYKYTLKYIHGLGTNSAVKTHLDSWYTSNISSTYRNYLSKTAIYCNDRTIDSTNYWASNGGWNPDDDNEIYFSAYARLQTGTSPSFVCSEADDKFTTSTTTGNAALTYPIALITADEVVYAGGSYSADNTSYYLYQNANSGQVAYWWTMSPNRWNGSSYVWRVGGTSSEGRLGSSLTYGILNNNSGFGVRPVLSLKSCVQWSSGNGTSGSPYKVSLSTACSSAEN